MKKVVLGLLVLIVASCAPQKPQMAVEKGVSLELAEHRKATVRDINYALHLTIPRDQDASIEAKETITLTLNDVSQDLQLDFMAAEGSISSLVVNGADHAIQHMNEHVVIDRSALKAGVNSIDLSFIAGDTSLNRNPDYLYTIFVPDRARTAFPIFDQPNLKATYDLTLDLPKGWTSIANGPLKDLAEGEARDVFTFDRSDLISTYLFTFVAGEFETITRDVDGVEMTMLHRETDEEKVARNVDDIFTLHKAALDWLEDYTGIPYPFKKFGFAFIPTFQFGGMEHVGAIHYRASSLFLDEDPSTPRQLSRASLIAHETAHMWFGDLVTMDWFNDVWTKEVFANFMASKIVNPSFPNVDHDLNFLLGRYPSAYGVDRTEGANPIRQHLPNLNEAGTMYGGIIYNKAPIMMQQLEMLVGKETFQKGMQEYLKTYAFDNATWPALVGILDKLSEHDLVAWSDVWVNTAGRPNIKLVPTAGAKRSLDVVQSDPTGEARVWPQGFTMVGKHDFTKAIPVDLKAGSSRVDIGEVDTAVDGFLVNGDGKGYGLFPISMPMVADNWTTLSDVQKGAAMVALYEQLVENTDALRPSGFMDLTRNLLTLEKNPLLVRHILNRMSTVYWTLLSTEDRQRRSADLESVLWAKMVEAGTPAMKKMYYGAYSTIALGDEALATLKTIWATNTPPEGVKLNEQDYISLAANLAVKIPAEADVIVKTQLTNIKNPDRKRRFEFIMPALSADPAQRDAFVLSLSDEKNRRIESWVLGALGYIHHPLRIEQSEKYIQHGLDLMQEIQITGDIFFPGRWSSVILANHRSDAAVKTVRDFFKTHPDYNHQMGLKILQAADPLFRANKILNRGK